MARNKALSPVFTFIARRLVGRAALSAVVTWMLAACATGPTPVPDTTPGPAEPAAAPAATPAPKAAPAEQTAIAIGERKTMRSELLGEDRTYLVYTPPGYATSGIRYPVLYLLDGEGHFHHATGIVDYLSRRGRMSQMIVVGIANTDRSRDLTPTNEARIPTSGGADRFLGFIKDELMPEIERAYRVAPYRILVGHSFGGLLAVHALLSRPEMFHAYVAISPSLQWDNQLMVRTADAAFPGKAALDRFLYITLGTEPEDITRGNQAFVSVLERKAPRGLAWKFTLMEKEDHGSVPHRSIYDGLELLFADWLLPETTATLADFTGHYERLSQKFGFAVPMPEAQLNLLGYRLMLGQQPNMAEAFAAFELNVKLYPESANVYDSLGEAHERSGDMAKAATYYEMAVARAGARSDPLLATFEQNLARARKALDGK